MKFKAEYFKERKEKREELIDYLPTSLQLSEKKINPVKWNFSGNLVRGRNYNSEEYKRFFDILKLKNKNLNPQEEEQLSKLEEESKESKKLLAFPLLITNYFEQAMKDSDSAIRQGAAQSLSALASLDQEKYIELIEQAMKDSYWAVRRKAAQSISALASLDQEKYIELIEQAMKDSDSGVRQGAAQSLSALASLYREDYLKLLEQAMKDGNQYVRLGAAQSLSALASLDQGKYIELIEQAMKDNDWDVRRKAAQSISALASLDQEKYIELIEQAMKDSDSGVREGSTQSLSALDNIVNNESQALKKDIQDVQKIINNYPRENQVYLGNIIGKKLMKGESVQGVLSGEYQDYQKIKELSKEWNNELDETKQVKDVDQWWSKYNLVFSQLQFLDRKMASSIVLSFKSEGLLALQSHLDIYEKVIFDNEIYSSLKKLLKENHSLDPNNFDKLLQTTHAYLKMNKIDVLQEIVNNNSDDYQNKLDDSLVKILAQSLGIEIEGNKHSLEGWDTKYIPNLSSNEEMIKRSNNHENVLELYKEMLKAAFEDRFAEFITNPEQDNEVGRDLARHNSKVKKEFEQLDINWNTWLHYQHSNNFTVETEKKVSSLSRFKETLKERATQVLSELEEIRGELSEREYLPLVYIIEGTDKKNKLKDISNYQELNKRYKSLLERINTLKDKHHQIDFSPLYEHIQHLKEAVNLFQDKEATETTTLKKAFRTKLWDRNPKQDLFQGNYTHCCIAVGVKPGEQEEGLNTHDPSTVLQYLVDQGINVVEIRDETNNTTIAQVWLFVSRDELGEPILVADNFEVHNNYVSDTNINNKIRDNMFSFLREYAKELNINKVGLGRVNTNDVEWQSLKTLNTPTIDKVGGYLSDYTLDISDRQGRYYLETHSDHSLAEIMNIEDKDKIKEKEEIKTGRLIIFNDNEISTDIKLDKNTINEIKAGQRNDLFSEEDTNSIERIEQESFGPMAEDIETILQYLKNDRGIQMLFKSKNVLQGYLCSLPANEFPAHNDAYDNSKDNLYIESIAGKVPLSVFNVLKEKAKASSYTKISMHGINERLNNVLKKRAGFKTKETISNWIDDKSAEYMEYEL